MQRPVGIDAEAVVTVFRVPPDHAGMRLDSFVQLQLHRTSRSRANAIIRHSAYSAEGTRVRPGSRVYPEQRIVLWRPPWDEEPPAVDIPIVYEDEHLLAINKPAGMPVHPTARYHKSTVIVRMKELRPGEWLSLGHRLDRETSGLLLITKTPACDRALKRMLEEREDIEKVYLAIATPPPQEQVFRVDAPMKLDTRHSTQVKMCVSSDADAMVSGTRFRVLEVRTGLKADGDTEASPKEYALIECTLETGRQHQIRLHLSHVGSPLVGDKLYGPDDSIFARGADNEMTEADVALMEIARHALHAHRLRLAHPITGAPLEVTAPMPEDLTKFWEDLQL
jgi:23S rRNA pseudouridine1911/1915/1917 synthase